MAHSPIRTFVLCLAACVTVMSTSMVVAADAEGKQPQALDYAGIYALRQIEPNLTGSGVKFAVVCRSNTYIDGAPQNDYRPDTGHNCFKAGRFSFNDQNEPSPAVSSHSTAVCSILFGNDPNAFNSRLGRFRYEGVTPDAQVDVYEFWQFLINNVFFNQPPDVDILTASIGNQFEDWWTRGIDAMAEQYGLIVVTGIGNGYNAYDPPLYPGAGANAISVGVVDSVDSNDLKTRLGHFSLAYPEHSSFGPTADGRCKPDIVAPGNCVAANLNEPNGYEPTGNWSSFSTPIAAGTIGLLVQKAKHDPNLAPVVSPDGGNCVIKAILLNSATKLPYWHKGRLEKDDDHLVPLDYIQGAGLLNAVGAYRQLTAGRHEPNDVPAIGWDLNHIPKNKVWGNSYHIALTAPADRFITATLAWNKHYDNVYPFEPKPQKDADLRLELWAIDSNDSNGDYLLDYSDSKNDNLEHIYIRADANYTDYEIVVSYSNIGEPNEIFDSQTYGLAWNVANAPDGNNILLYDLNADGIVNELDFIILANNLLAGMKTPERYLIGDINGDGIIDSADLQILLNHAGLEADWHKK